MPPPAELEASRGGPNIDRAITAFNEQIKDRKNDELSRGVLVADGD
ncbi:hypothetical protein [Sorangium sp. So ce204]